jgi:hypothetical protein
MNARTKQWFWFIGLYLASIVVLFLITWAIRSILQLVSGTAHIL